MYIWSISNPIAVVLSYYKRPEFQYGTNETNAQTDCFPVIIYNVSRTNVALVHGSEKASLYLWGGSRISIWFHWILIDCDN